METESLLFKMDRSLVGSYQVEAADYRKLADDQTAEYLAFFREIYTLGSGLESLGKGFVTYGLASPEPSISLAVGTAMLITGRMLVARFQNEAGTIQAAVLSELIQKIGPYEVPFKAAMINAGIPAQELDLKTLANQAYMTELNRPQVKRFFNTASTVSTSTALALTHDYASAAFITTLGALSIPIGEHFYKESNLLRLNKRRALKSAKMSEGVRQSDREHISMTDKTNFLNNFPDLLIAAKYYFEVGGSAFAAMYGAMYGLGSLNDALTQQRNRITSLHTTEMIHHFIEVVSKPPFIMTQKRWLEHIQNAGEEVLPIPKINHGIMLENFKALQISAKDKSLMPITAEVGINEALLLRAGSGLGKSTTLMAMLHLIEHEGQLGLVKDGVVTSVHKLADQETIQKKILIFSTNELNTDNRIVDYFREVYLNNHQEEHARQMNAAKSKKQKELVELAWKMEDNLLEVEIEMIKTGKPTYFKKGMLNDLEELRKSRLDWANQEFKARGGNLGERNIDVCRVAATFSEGEKKAAAAAIAEILATYNGIEAVILDEPLASLDHQNQIIQMQRLKCIQSHVPLIMVSHEHVEWLKNELNNCQLMDLEQPNGDQGNDHFEI